MWIYSTLGFFSIVAHRDKPEHFLLRGRRPGDVLEVLDRFMPRAQALARVQVTPEADYLERAEVTRAELDAVLQVLADATDYPNFKAAIARRAPWLSRVFHAVYDRTLALQPRSGRGLEHLDRTPFDGH